jgi:predicted DNA-binding transcriptional regulator AlpA
MAGDELLHTKQVEQEYGINAGTLRYWRSTNQGPASFSLGQGGRVVYRRSEVERWIAAQERATRRGGVEAV